jgi:hypothetical protein
MYAGIVDCTKQILAKEGLASFYRGLIPPLLGVGALNAVLFGSYATTKQLLVGNNPSAHVKPWQHFVCGTPLTVVKAFSALGWHFIEFSG